MQPTCVVPFTSPPSKKQFSPHGHTHTHTRPMSLERTEAAAPEAGNTLVSVKPMAKADAAEPEQELDVLAQSNAEHEQARVLFEDDKVFLVSE